MHKIAQKVTSVALAASMLLSMFAVNTVAFADEFKDNTTVSDEVTEAPVSDDEVDAVESVDAAMDFFHNILKRDDKLEVSIKSTETGFSLTDNSEPDVSYIMTLVPMDDSFWETCTASKNR